MPMKKTPAALLISLLLCLSACGTRGALTLPPGPPPEPLFGRLKPVNPATPATPAVDVSTPASSRP